MENKFETASLFIIGTELTRGIICDRHAQLICNELTHLGYDIRRVVMVPDDGTIATSMEESSKDSDVLLVTGGLGPTSDDMTRQTIASLANVPLEKNQLAWDELYQRVGERIHGANEKQAFIPKGFDRIVNPKGTAPGFKGFFYRGERQVFVASMPGPPVEMQEMFYSHVLPSLASLRGHDNPERDEFSVFLTPESKLEELCNECTIDSVLWATRFQSFRVSLYVSGSIAQNRDIAERKLSNLIGEALVVPGNKEASGLLIDILKEKHFKVSTAESCTSGLVAKMLTDQAGSSSWYWGGACTYANEAKQNILGVSKEILDTDGPVSEKCALAMAEGIRAVSKTDLAISVTGIAGPDGGEPNKPVGTVCFGFASSIRPSQAVKLKFTSWGRDSVRGKAAVASLILARLYLLGSDIIDTVSRWVYI